MFQFIFTIILMLSLGTILYLTARSLPRIEENSVPKSNILDKLISSELPGKIDAAFYNFLEKIMRRLKISLMKIDNSLTEKLKKINRDDNEKQKIDFSKINGKDEANE